MAQEVRRFECIVPAATPKATPVTIPMAMPPRTVQWIRLWVPSGPNGQMGFAILLASTQLIPVNSGSWLVMNDDSIEMPMENYPDSGAWSLRGYNTGSFPHTVYVTFGLALPPISGAGGSVLLAPADLSGST